MSNPITPISGRSFEGDVSIHDGGLQGMITLRGDLTNNDLIGTCEKLTGQSMPGVRRANVSKRNGICWMSSDELLLLVPYDTVSAAMATLSESLKTQHHLVAIVSDARCYLTVSGDAARDVMAKNTPVDLHHDQFQPSDFRRSRLGQVAAAFWLDDAGVFHVIAFRSVADYVYGLLVQSAKDGVVGVHFKG